MTAEEKERLESEIRELDRYLAENPNDAEAYVKRGDANSKLERLEKAINDYSSAIKRAPKSHEAFNRRGSALYNLERYDEAIRDFERAIKLAPETAILYVKRALAKARKRQFSEAFSDIKRSIELDSSNLSRYFQMNDIVNDAFIIDGFRVARTQQEKQSLYLPHCHFKLKELRLTNIGHFEEETVFTFDKSMTCIVGKNGMGKSTVVKALALALIGRYVREHGTELMYKTRSLIRRQYDPSQNGFIYSEEGRIELDYTLDETSHTNVVSLSYVSGGGTVFTESGPFHTRLDDGRLAHLFLGFPQHRDEYNPNYEKSFDANNPPVYSDILPLLAERDDHRLNYFIAWLANLETKLRNDGKEGQYKDIVRQTFQMINDSLLYRDAPKEERQIDFIKFIQVSPPQMLVKTFDNPDGVTVDMLGVGFKYTMGWLGYIFSRLYEAYPKDKTPIQERRAVVIFDEIDASIHPYWQVHLLRDLQNTFPNIQFIVTSHSPLSVAGLNREQVILVEQDKNGGGITARQSPIDLWVLSVQDILRKLFSTPEPEPTKSYEELMKKLGSLDEDATKEEETTLDEINRILDSLEYEPEN